jgi:ribonuclease III
MEPNPLEATLGHRFLNPALLRQALTHPSKARGAANNQRLEFLGDAVLQMLLTDLLFHQYPGRDEGVLTQIRARAVNRDSLAAIGRTLGLGQHLLLGHGEERNEGRVKPGNLADAVEAILGAVYLDSGTDAARAFVQRHFADILANLAGEDEFNPKGTLQELLQSRGLPTPTYEVEEASGPDHEKHFRIRVMSVGQPIGTGAGNSKKTAEQDAARAALAALTRLPPGK